MAYRINKAFGLNTTLSKLIDEITFTVNDIDRRLQEAEKKKAETVTKTVIKTVTEEGSGAEGSVLPGIVKTIDKNSTDETVPSSKAVWRLFTSVTIPEVSRITEQTIDSITGG